MELTLWRGSWWCGSLILVLTLHEQNVYSTFSDWFSQAVIDYILGNRNLSVFSEFLLKLQSSDPRDLIRLSRIRTEASPLPCLVC